MEGCVPHSKVEHTDYFNFKHIRSELAAKQPAAKPY